MKKVQDFVARCDICQRNKSETLAPAGLLHPLPIPKQIWEDISLDFTSGLPKSNGFNCILVAVDRLSKYEHFVSLRHPFTARSVAEIFAKEIVRLHGVPRSIVSDRDPLFMSVFWQEFFKSSGTKLKMSTAYHPETDGQTEVLNRCLETYLRCFSSEQPRTWGKWLHWAEFCYNSSFQGAAKLSPFEVVYGRKPPTILQFTLGEFRVAAVAAAHEDRNEILRQLHYNLNKAQQTMIKTTNSHRRDVDYEEGDLVYLKIRPHRQTSLSQKVYSKLGPRFYEPYKILQKMSSVVYKLDLPSSSRVHPIFHISLLKKAKGDDVVASDLPVGLMAEQELFVPDAIISSRQLGVGETPCHEVLVQWEGKTTNEATWLSCADFRGQFPYSDLVDKVCSRGVGSDSRQGAQEKPLLVYSRRRKVVEQPVRA